MGDVADHYGELQRLGVEVYSVSTDTHFTHKAWHHSSETTGKIEYTMIGDPTGTITRNFDAMRDGAKTSLGAFDFLVRTTARDREQDKAT